ncbi:hypothetical protein [Paracoccus sp. PAR01]|uniref:hypothetical protein n=1 Tax=Paracoccus sp. PAR01 TaxID=2769282 RepID=UPI0017864425|nr:hypothetical protein [Paracoccus sp. PAR01]MBD9528369.1 hypothetical protein [Paracoccus sp. PAR01]
MTENPDPLLASAKAALATLIAIPALAAALWGGLGGATNALVIRVTALEALRHIAIGAAVAAGLCGLAGPILAHWLGMPPGMITRADGASVGSLGYLSGSLGGAIFEALLTRIRAGRLPHDKAP